MKDAAPRTIYLQDYAPFGWQVSSAHLTFRLAPEATRVISRLHFAPNPDAPAQDFECETLEAWQPWKRPPGLRGLDAGRLT